MRENSQDDHLILTFFMDCDHIYVQNGINRGSTSSPHIGDVVMSLFFTLGSTVHDWGWPKNGPFWTKNGQTWQACQRSKGVQKGPKGTKMVNLSLFDNLGPKCFCSMFIINNHYSKPVELHGPINFLLEITFTFL